MFVFKICLLIFEFGVEVSGIDLVEVLNFCVFG